VIGYRKRSDKPFGAIPVAGLVFPEAVVTVREHVSMLESEIRTYHYCGTPSLSLKSQLQKAHVYGPALGSKLGVA
jgi:hypothetical protein